MINLKLSNTFPYKEILKKVRTNFDKMKKVSKIEKEYKKTDLCHQWEPNCSCRLCK